MAKGWNETPAVVYRTVDDQNRIVQISVNFNLSTLNITNPGIEVHRDPGCAWDILHIGISLDRPIRQTFPIPDGDTTISRGQLNSVGFNTVQEVADAGITFSKSGG